MARETLTVKSPFMTLDLLLFRHLRREVPGLVEATLALNPGLAQSAILPLGTKVILDRPRPRFRLRPPL